MMKVKQRKALKDILSKMKDEFWNESTQETGLTQMFAIYSESQLRRCERIDRKAVDQVLSTMREYNNSTKVIIVGLDVFAVLWLKVPELQIRMTKSGCLDIILIVIESFEHNYSIQLAGLQALYFILPSLMSAKYACVYYDRAIAAAKRAAESVHSHESLRVLSLRVLYLITPTLISRESPLNVLSFIDTVLYYWQKHHDVPTVESCCQALERLLLSSKTMYVYFVHVGGLSVLFESLYLFRNSQIIQTTVLKLLETLDEGHIYHLSESLKELLMDVVVILEACYPFARPDPSVIQVFHLGVVVSTALRCEIESCQRLVSVFIHFMCVARDGVRNQPRVCEMVYALCKLSPEVTHCVLNHPCFEDMLEVISRLPQTPGIKEMQYNLLTTLYDRASCVSSVVKCAQLGFHIICIKPADENFVTSILRMLHRKYLAGADLSNRCVLKVLAILICESPSGQNLQLAICNVLHDICESDEGALRLLRITPTVMNFLPCLMSSEFSPNQMRNTAESACHTLAVLLDDRTKQLPENYIQYIDEVLMGLRIIRSSAGFLSCPDTDDGTLYGSGLVRLTPTPKLAGDVIFLMTRAKTRYLVLSCCKIIRYLCSTGSVDVINHIIQNHGIDILLRVMRLNLSDNVLWATAKDVLRYACINFTVVQIIIQKGCPELLFEKSEVFYSVFMFSPALMTLSISAAVLILLLF